MKAKRKERGKEWGPVSGNITGKREESETEKAPAVAAAGARRSGVAREAGAAGVGEGSGEQQRGS